MGDEGLVGRLILLHLHIPTDETGGEAGVLATTADRFGEFLFVHFHEDGFLRLVDRDGLDLGGLERLGHERADVVAPANDVHFLVVQLADDILDPGTAQTDAGTDRIDFFVGAVDRDLGAVSSLASERADFDGAVGDFADLRLKEAAHKIRMAARKDDLGAACAIRIDEFSRQMGLPLTDHQRVLDFGCVAVEPSTGFPATDFESAS